MFYPVTITSKWQMTLPKHVRELFNIDKPGKVFVEIDQKQKAIRVNKPISFLQLAGTLKPEKVKNALTLRKLLTSSYGRS